MKTIILVFVYFSSVITAQPWINTYNVENSDRVKNVEFIDATTGWITISKYSGTPNIVMKKTVNKGLNWFNMSEFNAGLANGLDLDVDFVDNNLGFRVYYSTDLSRTIVERTYNGGSSWDLVFQQSVFAVRPTIRFLNSLTGFLLLSYYIGNRAVSEIHKSTDGGSNWSIKRTLSQENNDYFLNDIAINTYNGTSEIWAVGYYRSIYAFNYTNGLRCISTDLGENFALHTEPDNGQYSSYDFVSALNTPVPSFVIIGIKKDEIGFDDGTYCTKYSGTNRFDLFLNNNSVDKYIGGVSFSSGNFGMTVIRDKVYKTENAGVNWAIEYSFQDEVYYCYNVIKSIGNVGYYGTWHGQLHTRQIVGSFSTNFDWQGSSPGTLAIDGSNITTPDERYFRGGTTSLYALPVFENIDHDTIVRFYYWGGSADASMNYDNHPSYLIYDNSQINAEYKTFLKSTNSSALSNANQIKILKDTNGVTNLIYESMQGIFFTRTRPDGKYKAEEVVSGTNNNINPSSFATFQNSNPYLAEIKSNTTEVNKEKNLVACWERREENNIIKILVAYRVLSAANKPSWALNDSITLENMPVGFKCIPKIMISGLFLNDTKVITYLKPASGSNVKLAAKVIYHGNLNLPELEVIPGTNLQEYAIATLPTQPNASSFDLHLAYRVGQTIFYKKCFIGWDGQLGAHVTDIWSPLPISRDDASQRSSIDIDVRNYANSNNPTNTDMQPVITYQGVRNVRVIIQNEDGPPSEIQGTYYPIYVRERITQGWSSVIKYDPINTLQQTPNIVASKLMNSCLLSFKRNSIQVQTAPRWNDSEPNYYHCDPNTFSGTDAKLIKGALVHSTNYGQKLTTLSVDGQIYNIGSQPFSVTDAETTPNFETITGIVVDENVRYSFNLGNIMINWNSVGFSTDIDTVIEDTPDMNEGMKSENFLLNENDTLIIGRNAFYIVEGTSTPVEIEYKVKLMNKTLEQEHRLLVHDTLQSGDTLQIEFLEGYIITDIPGGSDSFYVQLEVDTLDGNHGLIGGDSGGEEGGDNIAGRRMIYWEGKTPNSVSSNNLPREFNLYQNFPNPFNPATILKYDLPKDVNVTIKIYDLLGREVAQLVRNEFKKAGRYEASWNAKNYASGVYIYRIEAGDFIATKKMVLIK